jgi:hypothetical protein
VALVVEHQGADVDLHYSSSARGALEAVEEFLDMGRLAIAILAAAFVVGVGVILVAFREAGWSTWVVNILLYVGLIAVFVLAFGLAVNMWRSQRW